MTPVTSTTPAEGTPFVGTEGGQRNLKRHYETTSCWSNVVSLAGPAPCADGNDFLGIGQADALDRHFHAEHLVVKGVARWSSTYCLRMADLSALRVCSQAAVSRRRPPTGRPRR